MSRPVRLTVAGLLLVVLATLPVAYLIGFFLGLHILVVLGAWVAIQVWLFALSSIIRALTAPPREDVTFEDIINQAVEEGWLSWEDEEDEHPE